MCSGWRILACRRHGLEGAHGRRFDDLPAEVLQPFADALVRSLEPQELRRALRCAISALQRESTETPDLAVAVEAQLRELAESSASQPSR